MSHSLKSMALAAVAIILAGFGGPRVPTPESDPRATAIRTVIDRIWMGWESGDRMLVETNLAEDYIDLHRLVEPNLAHDCIIKPPPVAASTCWGRHGAV